MLAKGFSDNPLCPVSVDCFGKCSFAGNDAQPSLVLVILHEEYLEIFICNMLAMDDMAKTIFAQQSLRRR